MSVLIVFINKNVKVLIQDYFKSEEDEDRLK